jgi:prolipoprotein diacylglyceryltransferase
MKSGLYGFLFAMWALIIIGGGIMVVLLGPFSIQQFGDFHWIIESGIKVSIALILVVLWILILSKLKNWIFKKELNS